MLEPAVLGPAVLEDVGYAAVRVVTGLFILPHAGEKLFGWFGADRAAFATAWDAAGLKPGAMLVPLVGTAEFAGGLALAAGFGTRFAALLIAATLGVASFWYLRARKGWLWNHGGREFPVFWFLIACAFVIGGGGSLSLDAMLFGRR